MRCLIRQKEAPGSIQGFPAFGNLRAQMRLYPHDLLRHRHNLARHLRAQGVRSSSGTRLTGLKPATSHSMIGRIVSPSGCR